ncbi:MAG: class I SAM-dependent methyltransferase [Candidatus Binatia bacterium]
MANTSGMPLEERIVRLMRHLHIEDAHVAACMPHDWEGLLTRHRERIRSLTLLCPMAINPTTLGSSPPPTLVVTGDRGRSALDAQCDGAKIAAAKLHVLQDYFSPPWADPIADRRDDIGAALTNFISAVDTSAVTHRVNIKDTSGEIAELSFVVRGVGAPLLLMPLALAPSQWGPLVDELSRQFCTITLGGAHLGMVAHLESRAQSGYMNIIDQLINELELTAGRSLLEVGCGSGAILRHIAKRTHGQNRIVGIDMNRYLLREAAALARREELDGHLELGGGNAEELPFPDHSFDATIACTVMEEGAADRMLAEIVRVTKPGGRVGAVVRSTDLPRWVNLPLKAELKYKIEASGLLGGNVGEGGCADARLYRLMSHAGLTNLQMMPQWVSYNGGERLQFLHDRIVSQLNAEEIAQWQAAVSQGNSEGTFFISEPFHCAVGTKR